MFCAYIVHRFDHFRKSFGDRLDLFRQRTIHLEGLAETLRYGSGIAFGDAPDVGRQVVLVPIVRPRISDVEDVADFPAILAEEADTLQPFMDTPMEALFPEVMLRAGGGRGPVLVNHELITE